MWERRERSNSGVTPEPEPVKRDRQVAMDPKLYEAGLELYGGVEELEWEVRVRGVHLVERDIEYRLDEQDRAKGTADPASQPGLTPAGAAYHEGSATHGLGDGDLAERFGYSSR